MPARLSQSGFSLIELIVIVVLLGVLASGAGLLIVKPIEAYEAQVRRQQLVDQGEIALRQIARDVRRALPNSLRVTTLGPVVAVEMINTIDGARYRDEVGGDFVLPSDTLEFTAADSAFNLLGLFNALAPGLLTGDVRLVVYNTPDVNIYADAQSNSNPGVITTAATALTLSLIDPPNDGDEHQITMVPPFQFSQQSPGQRLFAVDGPLSYVCDPGAGQILRYSNHGYSTTQTTTPAGGSDVLISQLDTCSISYNPGTAQRTGVLTVQIRITDRGESIDLLHQVHVVNVP